LDALHRITLLKAKFDINWQTITRQLVTNQLVYITPTVAEWMLYKLTLMPCTCEMKVMVVSVVSNDFDLASMYIVHGKWNAFS